MAKTQKKQAATEGKTNQAKAARTALEVRDEVIESLESCKSNAQFLDILDKYNLDKKKGVFSIGSFTSKQHGKIADADAEIKALIIEKKIYFAHKIRTDLIHSLESCTSNDQLLEILDRYDQDKEDKLYKINLNDITEEQFEVIKQLNLKITILIESKMKEFQFELDEEVDEIIQKTDSPRAALAKPTHHPEMGSRDTHVHESSKTATQEKVIHDRAFFTHKKGRIDPLRLIHVADVKAQLLLLSDKRAEFSGRLIAHQKANPGDTKKAAEYMDAKKALDNIYNKINGLYESYIRKEIDLDQFKTDANVCLAEGSDDVQILKSHRGVKQILVNLLAFFLTGGIGYGIAALATGRLMLFNPSTNTGQKTDDLLQSIDMASVSPAA